MINIPKDLLVKSASVKEVTEADQPYEGAAVGDKYIDFVINSVEGDANGEATFHCEITPENDLTVNILRLEVVEK